MLRQVHRLIMRSLMSRKPVLLRRYTSIQCLFLLGLLRIVTVYDHLLSEIRGRDILFRAKLGSFDISLLLIVLSIGLRLELTRLRLHQLGLRRNHIRVWSLSLLWGLLK